MTASRARPRVVEIQHQRPEPVFMDSSILTRNELPALPAPSRDLALFLDLDGTLLDIAATPDSVTVPPDLVSDLQHAARALNGAVAIVSGRALAVIDRLLAPLQLACGSEHGTVVRLPDGTEETAGISVPAAWVRELMKLEEATPGLLIEVKPHNVVAHFRNAPEHAADAIQLARALVSRRPETFEVMDAKMAVEIRPRAITKAYPVNRLMAMPPFHGRIPVFIGDDVTDEDGFEATLAHGGHALHVAAHFDGRPQNVRDWLKRVAGP